MTSGGPGGAGRAWRSSLGGRTVSRTATAIQGASLRTLPLVLPARLASLTNPLEPLLAGPPSLDVLGETAARATGGDTVPRSRRSAPPALRPGENTVARSPGSPGSPTPSPTGLTGVPAVTGHSASSPHIPAGTRLGEPSLPSANPSHGEGQGEQSAVSSPGTPTAPGQSARGARVARAGNDSAAAPPLAATIDRITAAALAAADGGKRRGPTSSAETRSTAGADSPDVGSSSAARRVLPDQAPMAGRPAFPFTAAAALGGGALGELVGRWQQSEPLPEPAPMTASRSPFTPLSNAATTGFATSSFGDGGRSPDGAGDEVSLDQVQLALDELLRREVEQHGLEGGLV